MSEEAPEDLREVYPDPDTGFPVQLTGESPVRIVAAEFGSCMTWTIPAAGGTSQPLAIVQRSLYRSRAKIVIVSLGGAISVLFNSNVNALSNNQGFQVNAADGAFAENEGSVAAPGANTNIVSLALSALTPGSPYLIQWAVALDGTPGAADINNFRLRYNAVNLEVSENNGAVGRYPQTNVDLTAVANPAGALLIQSIGAATAGSVYTGQISATPLATLPVPYQLPLWESQQPLYAIATGGTPLVAVIDERYANQ